MPGLTNAVAPWPCSPYLRAYVGAAGRQTRRAPLRSVALGGAGREHGRQLRGQSGGGGSDWIGGAVPGWPSFALLTAVKLLFGLLDHPPTGAADNEPAVRVRAHGP